MKTFKELREELNEVSAGDYQKLYNRKTRIPADKFGDRGSKTKVMGQIARHVSRTRMKDIADIPDHTKPVTAKVKKDMVFRKKVLGQRGTVMGQRDRVDGDY